MTKKKSKIEEVVLDKKLCNVEIKLLDRTISEPPRIVLGSVHYAYLLTNRGKFYLSTPGIPTELCGFHDSKEELFKKTVKYLISRS